MDEETGSVVDALRTRRIHAWRVSALEPDRYVTVSMSASDAERFIDILIEPLRADDEFAMRIFGRPQDLTVSDEPWKFEVTPGITDQDLAKLHVYVSIPLDDVDEALARLRDIKPID